MSLLVITGILVGGLIPANAYADDDKFSLEIEVEDGITIIEIETDGKEFQLTLDTNDNDVIVDTILQYVDLPDEVLEKLHGIDFEAGDEVKLEYENEFEDDRYEDDDRYYEDDRFDAAGNYIGDDKYDDDRYDDDRYDDYELSDEIEVEIEIFDDYAYAFVFAKGEFYEFKFEGADVAEILERISAETGIDYATLKEHVEIEHNYGTDDEPFEEEFAEDKDEFIDEFVDDFVNDDEISHLEQRIDELEEENEELQNTIEELEEKIENLNSVIMEQLNVIYEWILNR